MELLHHALSLYSRYSSDKCLTGAKGDLLITDQSSWDTDDVTIRLNVFQNTFNKMLSFHFLQWKKTNLKILLYKDLNQSMF